MRLFYPFPLQFVNNGMESLVEILARPSTPLSLENLAERVDRAGEILRLLSHVMEPFRTRGTVFQLDSSCQERLGKGICETLSAIEAMFGAAGAEELKRLTQCIIFVARLLQFKLGFGGTWMTTVHEQYEMLSSTLFRLALVCVHVMDNDEDAENIAGQIHASGSSDLDSVVYSLLIDTLYCVIDGISHESFTMRMR